MLIKSQTYGIKQRQSLFKSSNLTTGAVIHTEINQGLSFQPDIQTFRHSYKTEIPGVTKGFFFLFVFSVTGFQFYLSEEVNTVICVFCVYGNVFKSVVFYGNKKIMCLP